MAYMFGLCGTERCGICKEGQLHTKFCTVTLVHNQAANLPYILAAYTQQSRQPDLYCFVLDRCNDDSDDVLVEFSKNTPTILVRCTSGNGFSAGRCRDLGVDALPNCSNVLFLDGDCVPSCGLFAAVADVLESSDIAIVSRKSQQPDLTTYTEDSRAATPWLAGQVFNQGWNTSVQAKELARLRMLVWSCGLGLSSAAMLALKQVNKELTGNSRIFSSAFDGCWGGEDDFVGLVAMLLDMSVVGVDLTHNVSHIWHQPRTSDAFLIYARQEYEKLKSLCMQRATAGVKYLQVDPNRFATSYFSRVA